jgi:hypothetical protein
MGASSVTEPARARPRLPKQFGSTAKSVRLVNRSVRRETRDDGPEARARVRRVS